jgi:hypothetical protein
MLMMLLDQITSIYWQNTISCKLLFFVYSSDSNDKGTLASFKREKEGKENKSTWNDES